MKKISIWLLLFLFLGSFMLSVTGCDLTGITIDARIESFIYDLNFDRDNVYTNFHPTETSDYDALKNVTFTIDPEFPGTGIPYIRGTLDTSVPTSVTTEITGNGAWGSKDAIFVMIKDGMTWYINDLRLDGFLIYD